MGGQLTAVNPSLEPALPKWSLFNDGTAVNLSLITLHPTSVSLRGRAVAMPSCDYTVILDVVDGNVDNNGEFDQFSFLFLEFSLENLIFQSIWTSLLTK